MIDFKRRGILEITEALMVCEKNEMFNFFKVLDFLPIEVSYNPMKGLFIYKGVSSNFELVKEGVQAPNYIIEITKEAEPSFVKV